jgi:hypothetical protein
VKLCSKEDRFPEGRRKILNYSEDQDLTSAAREIAFAEKKTYFDGGRGSV